MCRFRGRRIGACADCVAGAALCEPPCADCVAGAVLCEPPCADFVAGTALCEPRGADFVAGTALCEPPCADFAAGAMQNAFSRDTPRLRLVYLRIGYVLSTVLSYHQDSLEAIIKIDYPKIVFLWSILNY